ncbi:PhnA domain-containing protein [Reichenbachiella versicolor]|uniref:PhnA domain-containing protein n=1 Tax=Reichenbachiella versicolor TaxID=1821036 RepID=UPI000D6DEAD6|nr:alkylphosphonate utilization protein [Reichenbachiella versicolor]
MSLEKELKQRSSVCELCGNVEKLTVHTVSPKKNDQPNHSALICETCEHQIKDPQNIEINHWHCLNESMWSEIPAVQVLAYRMLHHLRSEGWAQNALEMLYLDEDTLEWARDGITDENTPVYKDSNGVILQHGDSVVVTKDLPVKGSSMVVKRGTAVRNITLAHDDPTHISGKVNGQEIYLVTKYLKKQ